MSLHPDDKIVFVVERGRRIIDAQVIACFRNPESADGNWFNCRTAHADPSGTALHMRDEGVTWSRDTSTAGREVLLAAFVLERSA